MISKGKGESENGAAVETSPSKSPEKSVRSSNRLQPDKEATGDHSTFIRDANDDIFKYQEWKANDKNPNGFDAGKHFDGGKKTDGLVQRNLTKKLKKVFRHLILIATQELLEKYTRPNKMKFPIINDFTNGDNKMA
ncbi:MAG TPA: hypothetical protein VL053_10505 [Arachidicoccus sp.]|nr:hypothetical protein [Arachidicoccus sp.]